MLRGLFYWRGGSGPRTSHVKPGGPWGHDAQKHQLINGPWSPFHPNEPSPSPETSDGKDQFGDPA